jgi:hypothetical protein
VKARIAKKVLRISDAHRLSSVRSAAFVPYRHRLTTRHRAWIRHRQLERHAPDDGPGKWHYTRVWSRQHCWVCKCWTTWHRKRGEYSPTCTGCGQPDIPF